MAATYRIDSGTGSGPTMAAFPAGGRFNRSDTHPTTDALTTFIPIPSSGINYSWRKSFKLNVTVAPVGTVSNLRFFSDGVSWGAGITPYAMKKSAYTQASGADNNAIFDGSAVDVTTYISASPLIINSGTVLTATTGYGSQDYLVMQIAIATTAAPGTTAARTLSYRVDET
jgi:hypothetical protein